MPLNPKASVGENIRELHTGKTYAHTAGKFGKDRANKQAIAIAMKTAGRAFGGSVDPAQAMGVAGTMGQMMPMGPGTAPAGGAPAGTNPAVPPPQGVMGPSLMPGPGSTPTPNMGGMAQPYGVGNLPGFGSMAPPQAAVGLAAGGTVDLTKGPGMSTSWQTKGEARQLHTGPVLSAVPGRTDAHAVKVPNGAYVIPSDSISGRGQGNTLAGMNFWQKRFSMGPYDTSSGSIRHGAGAPRPVVPRAPHMAAGGHLGHGTAAVPVNIAGGELVVPADKCLEFARKHLGRNVSLETAHRFLDALIVEERKLLVKQLKKLPGPVKS
jgi:hypothetical protein